MSDKNDFKLIVVGASAGGVEGLLRLVPFFPKDLPAAICVVVHTSPRARSLLPQLLSRAGALKAKAAQDGDLIRRGQIYVAPPDRHLTIENASIRLDKGPKENMSRPAIDPMFRTAAATFDGSVIGVLLSGMLGDGTSGLAQIKSAGGIAIVQDPEETAFSGMPLNAIRNVDVDYILPIEKIAQTLISLCREPELAGTSNRKRTASVPQSDIYNEPDTMICPECGGALRQLESDGTMHFKCHLGHAYSVEALLAGQALNVEKVLWSSVRALREKSALARKLAERFHKREKQAAIAERYERQAQKSLHEAELIISLLTRGEDLDDTGEPQ